MLDYFDGYAAADGESAPLVLMGMKMMRVPDETYLRSGWPACCRIVSAWSPSRPPT